MKLSKMGKKYPIAMTLFPCAHKHCWTHLYIKQLFQLQINVILNIVIIFINKSWLSVLFFTYTWICKSCSLWRYASLYSSSNLKWSFVQFVWGCTLLYVCSFNSSNCFQYLFLKDRTPGKSGNKTVLTPYFKYRYNLIMGWSKRVPRKKIHFSRLV